MTELTGEWLPGLGGGPRAAGDLSRGQRHHRERADGYGQPHRVPHGTPLPSKGKIRHFIDVGRLTGGR